MPCLTYEEGLGSSWRVAGAQNVLNNQESSRACGGLAALGQGLPCIRLFLPCASVCPNNSGFW